MRAVSDDAPLLDDLMPWSAAPLRLGRSWVLAPDAKSLRARWDALLRGGTAEREALFCPTRSRTVHSTVTQLPGHPAPTTRLADESGPCPEPVRVLHGPYDQQWLIPDHRLLDAARTELWRVADDRQLFAVEQGYLPQAPGPAVVCSALLPDGRSPAGRPGRIRPLYRRPGGAEPNYAPGLLDHLGRRCERTVTAEDLLAWIALFARHSPAGCVVPLPASGELWDAGVELGRTALDIQTRGARSGGRPRLPGGRRPYVRAPLPTRPDALRYDPQEEVLFVGDGRISPVPRGAWEFHAAGVRVLDAWFDSRTRVAEPGTLAAIGPAAWPQEWTSELLELITVLALLAELEPGRRALTAALESGPRTDTDELRGAGVLPVPDAARRPASVLDHPEEGPGGQFALL
ncbi:type ISP restriction/modification enzyme [Streptomyces sp. NPDC054933]